MKWIAFVVLMFISGSAFCIPGTAKWPSRDSATVIERKKAKIERQKRRIENKWDERSVTQKARDRKVLIFLAVSSAILLKSISSKE